MNFGSVKKSPSMCHTIAVGIRRGIRHVLWETQASGALPSKQGDRDTKLLFLAPKIRLEMETQVLLQQNILRQ